MKVTRRLKRPDGAVYEQFITASSHHFNNGLLVGHLHITEDGDYSGKFWFRYKNGKMTKTYTRLTAPKWLLALLEESNESH